MASKSREPLSPVTPVGALFLVVTENKALESNDLIGVLGVLGGFSLGLDLFGVVSLDAVVACSRGRVPFSSS